MRRQIGQVMCDRARSTVSVESIVPRAADELSDRARIYELAARLVHKPVAVALRQRRSFSLRT